MPSWFDLAQWSSSQMHNIMVQGTSNSHPVQIICLSGPCYRSAPDLSPCLCVPVRCHAHYASCQLELRKPTTKVPSSQRWAHSESGMMFCLRATAHLWAILASPFTPASALLLNHLSVVELKEPFRDFTSRIRIAPSLPSVRADTELSDLGYEVSVEDRMSLSTPPKRNSLNFKIFKWMNLKP